VIRWILDTNACIFLIKRRSVELSQRLLQCAVGEVGVSSITLSELEFGVAKSQQSARSAVALARFLAPLEVVAYDKAAAARYGPLRAHLEGRGTPIGQMDTLIAAHALALGCTVVTNDVREFRRVPGLAVEDWSKE